MADFQQRHYQALARIAQTMYAHADDHRKVDAAAFERELTDLFRRDNPAFKADLFAAACKPGANVNARKVKGKV
jgi:hypothetical protein